MLLQYYYTINPKQPKVNSKCLPAVDLPHTDLIFIFIAMNTYVIINFNAKEKAYTIVRRKVRLFLIVVRQSDGIVQSKTSASCERSPVDRQY